MKGLKILACTLLFVLLSACGINGNHQESAASSDTDVSPEEQESNSQTEDVNTNMPQEETSQVSGYEEKNNTVLQIQVKDSNHTIIFELNDSLAAQSLYDQLPLTVEVQDYSTNEKIFYPPEPLDTDNAVDGEGPAGSLAYFSPWGNVVMYYSDYGPYHGLYHLGNAVSGSEWISELTGTLDIQQFVEK